MEMSETDRQLFLWVADDNPHTLPILEHCYRLARRTEILKWFIRNNIRGKKFMEFYRTCDCSIITTFSIPLSAILREPKKNNIIAGVDYIG